MAGSKSLDLGSKIIVALDVDTRGQALALVEELPQARIVKIGLRLFSAEGPSLLEAAAGYGKQVFLDLKMHDIPHTVAGAVAVCASYGVFMLTLHASGGREMMKRAAEAAAQAADKQGFPRPILLGVTILTSLKDAELVEVGMPADAAGQVLKLAHLARESGLDGIVCSPQELGVIRRELGREFLVVTPGIRPSWAAAGDQKRILTPRQAIRQGADYLVIGRPIIASPSPGEAFQRIRQELDSPDA